MKKLFIILRSVLLALAVIGCENGLTSNHDGSMNGGNINNTALARIRSAGDDPVTDCAIEGAHIHNTIQYSGHYNNDGHGHQELQADTICARTDCAEIGLHQHNGTHYAGHAGNDNSNHHDNGRRQWTPLNSAT
jgi:hypothetical protein